MKSLKISSLIIIVLFPFVFSHCAREDSRVSTREDRAELFDYIIEKTKEREAFSPIKNQNLNYDPVEEMTKFREEMIAADRDEALFDVLIKISNARRDRHLSISPVQGGIQVNDSLERQAPLIFRVDFAIPGEYFFFIGDKSRNITDYCGEYVPDIGDKLTAVNSTPVGDYFEQTRLYIRYSSVNGLWLKLAEAISLQNCMLPFTMNKEEVTFSLEKIDGTEYEISLPYLEPGSISWEDHYKEHGEPRYKGFEMLYSVQTYDLYISEGNILLLDWYGFDEDLVKDMDRLVEYASENNMLELPLIWDGTRSRGGSKGAYAIQRLFPKPFKTTFGNVRISDVIPLFIAEREEAFKRRSGMLDAGVSETLDDGSWLMDWLRTDVQQAIDQGDNYSNNVPFKLAHLPKDSDGILGPAEVHFSGPVVCLFGPHGGSHLDQFAAMVVDNQLAYTIGMPTGGYSNTWEWEEVLTFPISKKPVVEFMWNIGHTIRPNGDILEGNPAQVDKYIPETRENYDNYYDILIEEALSYFDQQ